MNLKDLRNLKKRLASKLDKGLQRLGLNVQRVASSEEIRALIDLLRPAFPEEELVRIGSDGDGGYLVPNDLERLSGIISPGVGGNTDFELFFAERGVPCFLFDRSVDGPNRAHPLFSFNRVHLAPHDVEGAVSLATATGLASDTGDLILQMDIEGAEWDVLGCANEQDLSRFRLMVIEFHSLSDVLRWGHSRFRYRKVMEKILKQFRSVHFAANTYGGQSNISGVQVPEVVEVTFLRKDRRIQEDPYSKLPRLLDAPNALHHQGRDFLPKWWK